MNRRNNGIRVNRIVLGYMSLQMKDPRPLSDGAGVDFSEAAPSAGSSMTYTLFLFTINAIDGTVIDRELGY